MIRTVVSASSSFPLCEVEGREDERAAAPAKDVIFFMFEAVSEVSFHGFATRERNLCLRPTSHRIRIGVHTGMT